jgi:hypothetical protein
VNPRVARAVSNGSRVPHPVEVDLPVELSPSVQYDKSHSQSPPVDLRSLSESCCGDRLSR